MTSQKSDNDSLIAKFVSVVGAEHVLTDEESCSLYAQDVFTKAQPAIAVVQPDNSKELSELVKVGTELGCKLIARGGGMSYTAGLVPSQPDTVMVDLRRMNRVLEINLEDMYVTVECGCTWKELHAALQKTGYRTAYWGTLSGSKASIGGGLSQNAIFWGSGTYGSAADNVLGMEVVLADGSIVKTGSGAQKNSTPFFRHFGPDLTGIFTCDSGALGFKAVASLRLIRKFEGKQYCAFDFKEGADAIATMSEISRRGLAAECFGFDPFLQSQRLKRESLGKDVKALAGVMKASGSIVGALKDGAKVALSGRRYMDDVDYSVQVIIEDYNQAGADAKAKEIVAIAKQNSGKEISNSIPKIARANPFGPLNAIMGPTGERWVPAHVLISHSNAQASYQAILDLFTSHSDEFEKFKIETGFLLATISSNCFVLEPVFFWPDAATEIHAENIEADHFAKLTKYPEDLAARECVANVRKEFAAMFRDNGGVHLQIGKAYHYADGIAEESLALVNAIKQATDPKGLINPGALGLN
ncbi:MAG: FAD-binding oxidoreductase [Acidiferrobacterales bacterium]|nr:FAD-binding oxidoreductase [Acidiferrobacterales bacterium]